VVIRLKVLGQRITGSAEPFHACRRRSALSQTERFGNSGDLFTNLRCWKDSESVRKGGVRRQTYRGKARAASANPMERKERPVALDEE
jgi:hypothetical protein